MTKKIPLLLFLLFVYSISHTQRISGIRKKGIKRVEQKQFEFKDGKEIISRWSIDEYDNKGRIISEKQFNVDSTYKVFETYKYDRKGRIVEHCEFDKFGQLKKKTETDFDNMNDRKEERIFNSNNVKIELTHFVYNSFGLKTDEITYKSDGLTMLKRVSFTYDSKGSLIERKLFNEKNELIQVRSYSIIYN